MRRKRKNRAVVEPDAALSAAFDDARALAVEISCGRPSRPFDVMGAGLLLTPGEQAYRWLGVWVSVQDAGDWALPSWTQILITSRRLLCRCADGRLVSLVWGEVTGLQSDVQQQRLVFNYGAHPPIAMMGVETTVISVAAVANVFGVSSLLTHPALSLLRQPR